MTLFAYLSYMFFFVHALCGSNLTINEFLDISDRSLYAKNGWKDADKDPNSKLSTKLKAVGQVLATAVVFLCGKIYVPFGWLMTKEFQTGYPLWQKVLIAPLSASLNKCTSFYIFSKLVS